MSTRGEPSKGSPRKGKSQLTPREQRLQMIINLSDKQMTKYVTHMGFKPGAYRA